MTELLKLAIAQLEQLPPEQQDAIAARLLAAVHDQEQWETHLFSTTEEWWNQIAAMAYQEEPRSEIESLEQVAPSQP
ncbi:hypothetical protein Pse7367_3907 (plasmid) [Thalassoporum mexicanum PCC 7367]|uniref:hypothetical protein n=1 Tax=Thalassoporum mexicanum TaxID=3457544 RepID=UPI00029FD29B|nr:hypothetical protein [Pseudanabaena sp. PCC 7367]AFY72125.1 hypothetical protein Pse7367_3907 [Pseudanabaena sp. PCC 7367]